MGESRNDVEVGDGSIRSAGVGVADGTALATTAAGAALIDVGCTVATVAGVGENGRLTGGKLAVDGRAAVTVATGESCPAVVVGAEGSGGFAGGVLRTDETGALVEITAGPDATGGVDTGRAAGFRRDDIPGMTVSDTRRVIVGLFNRFVSRVTGVNGTSVATATGVLEKLITTGGGDGGAHATKPNPRASTATTQASARRGTTQLEWLAARHQLTPFGPLLQELCTQLAIEKRLAG